MISIPDTRVDSSTSPRISIFSYRLHDHIPTTFIRRDVVCAISAYPLGVYQSIPLNLQLFSGLIVQSSALKDLLCCQGQWSERVVYGANILVGKYDGVLGQMIWMLHASNSLYEHEKLAMRRVYNVASLQTFSQVCKSNNSSSDDDPVSGTTRRGRGRIGQVDRQSHMRRGRGWSLGGRAVGREGLKEWDWRWWSL